MAVPLREFNIYLKHLQLLTGKPYHLLQKPHTAPLVVNKQEWPKKKVKIKNQKGRPLKDNEGNYNIENGTKERNHTLASEVNHETQQPPMPTRKAGHHN